MGPDAVLGDIEAAGLRFCIDPQTLGEQSGQFRQDEGSDHGPEEHYPGRLELFQPKRPTHPCLDPVGCQVRIRVHGGKHAGHDGSERPAHRVNPEGVEGIVISKHSLQLAAGEVGREPVGGVAVVGGGCATAE